MKTSSSNKVGVFVLVLALASVAQLLFFSFSMRSTVECQSQVNQAFLSTLKVRAEIADGDREAIRSLVTDITSADTDAESEQALTKYYDRDRQLQALRNSFTYPEIGECR